MAAATILLPISRQPLYLVPLSAGQMVPRRATVEADPGRGARRGKRKMSGVLVLSAHEGLLDRRIVSEVNTLAASGRSVTLASVPIRLEESPLDPRIRTVVGPRARRGSLAGSLRAAARPLPRALRRAGRSLRYRISPPERWLRTGYFAGLVNGERFEAIHCHDLDTLPAGVLLRDRLGRADIPLVYDAHELFPFQEPDRAYQTFWSGVERRHIGRADLVITVNPSIAEEMAERYGISRPEVIYNGHETDAGGESLSRGAFLTHFATDGELARAIFPGRLERDRNLGALVEAFARLEGEAELLLLGGGSDEARLRRLCRRRGIRNVRFGPWVSSEDLIAHLRHATFGVVPYLGTRCLNHRLCTPNKLFEFMEAELPVCASDLPELRRIVEGCEIGRVYPFESPRAIERSIRDFLVRLRTGEFTPEALRAARERYSWRRQGEKLISLYQRLGV